MEGDVGCWLPQDLCRSHCHWLEGREGQRSTASLSHREGWEGHPRGIPVTRVIRALIAAEQRGHSQETV